VYFRKADRGAGERDGEPPAGAPPGPELLDEQPARQYRGQPAARPTERAASEQRDGAVDDDAGQHEAEQVDDAFDPSMLVAPGKVGHYRLRSRARRSFAVVVWLRGLAPTLIDR
jgi:hypothetical protein